MANAHLGKRSWLVAGLLLTMLVVFALTSGTDEATIGSQPIDSQVQENPVLDVSPLSNEIFKDSIAPSTATLSFVSKEPDIASFIPLDTWTKYSQRAEQGDLDATYILAFVINECRNVDRKGFIDRIAQSDLPPELKAAEEARFERCMPLVDEVGDTTAVYDRLYQTLHSEWHPLTMVNVQGNPPIEKRDRLIWALMGNYPEQFMYAQAFMAAAVYERENTASLDDYRHQAWTILYCEASLRCDSEEYLGTLRTSIYHDREVDEILEIASAIKEAILNGDPDALGI